LALIAAGCKGCGDSEPEVPGAMVEPARSDMEQLEHRIASLKIDLKQSFPKRADGIVDCGTNTDCFLVMAHRCEPAFVDHELSEPGLLTIKKVHAKYRITGADGETCKVLRLVLERDAVLPEEARKALVEKGKTASEIDAMQADALAYLVQHVPERTVCALPRGRALGLGLALLAKDSVDGFFRAPCHDPGEGDAWPADFVAPAADGKAPAEPAVVPAAAPDAPAAADAPKAKTAE
jgi:hypothetical protein